MYLYVELIQSFRYAYDKLLKKNIKIENVCNKNYEMNHSNYKIMLE